MAQDDIKGGDSQQILSPPPAVAESPAWVIELVSAILQSQVDL